MPLPPPIALAPWRIHPQTYAGHVHLKVANLESQTAFYQRVLGLHLHWQEKDSAGLGAGQADLVRLTQLPGGRRYHRVTGLYHFAILYPDRRELARAIARLFDLGWSNTPTDHVMTKTTYLDDPEGNTIELYCETPEDGVFGIKDGEFYAHYADGRPSSGREALNVEALFSLLAQNEPLDQPVPPGTRLGHFHLHVSDLDETRRFYHDLLGFDDMGTERAFRMGMVSAGGYHHHIGYNTWQGEGAPPSPPDALGLKHISFAFPEQAAWQELCKRLDDLQIPHTLTGEGILLRDPSQNGVLFLQSPA
ncbi:MAG: VOC family protein [Anaerolineales bacterium]|nr:VOC family protein [Anaerolineales bacterium]